MLTELGRFDGKNYYLIKDGKEVKVSQSKYELETTNNPLKRLLLEILDRLGKVEERLNNPAPTPIKPKEKK